MKGRVSRAFTLIEVLVVIAVIGILIGLSAVAYQAIRKSSRDTKRRADLQDIRAALELYRTDCRAYPASLGSSIVGSGVCSGNTYMEQVPADPIPSSYRYQYYLIGSRYNLCAYLENGSGSVDCSGDGSSTNDFCGNSLCNFVVSSP